jgi:hypothetical protein
LTPSPALIPLQPLVTLFFVECYIGPKGPASTIMELIIIIIIIAFLRLIVQKASSLFVLQKRGGC